MPLCAYLRYEVKLLNEELILPVMRIEFLNMFSAGEEVRVLVDAGLQARRGTVLLTNDDGSCEILLAKRGRQPEEEVTVLSNLMSKLHDFERGESPSLEVYTAQTWKAHGNTLFADKDYFQALEYYKKALCALGSYNSNHKTFELGEAVIVTDTRTIDCYPGLISDADADSRKADVVIESTNLEDNELFGVSFDLLLPLCKKEEDQLLQRSVYMNMARCSLKLEQKGWAIKYASIALAGSLALAQQQSEQDSAQANRSEVDKLLADCYYFRGKALIAACRPKFATQVLP